MQIETIPRKVYSDILTEGIIYQDVYQMQIFNKIIKLIMCYDYMYFITQKIKELLPFNWSGKKYLKKKKIKMYIFLIFHLNNHYQTKIY